MKGSLRYSQIFAKGDDNNDDDDYDDFDNDDNDDDATSWADLCGLMQMRQFSLTGT